MNSQEKNKRRYDTLVLRELQTVELDMLRVFVGICERHNIDYFCTFGTAIGAIRHKGFIPWDDDVDIGMMRSEYERLRSVPREEWGEDYFIADARDGVVYHRTLFPRMYKKGTSFETEQYWKYLKPDKVDKYPIYIDIFLFDRISSAKHNNIMYSMANMFKRALVAATCDCRIYSTDPISIKLVSKMKRIVIGFFSLFHQPEHKIYLLYKKCFEKNSGQFVTCFEVVERREVTACFCPVEDMFPTLKVPFEDITLRIQKNYDTVLRKLYSDYMQYPSPERRYNELPRVLDFGDGRGNVVEGKWYETDRD